VPRLAEVLERQPLLLHAYVSADLARRRFGVNDREVLAAIAEHTLGQPGMGPLQRLLYVADACSQDRPHEAAGRIRSIALRDLDRALVEAARNKCDWVERSDRWVHPKSRALLRWALARANASKRVASNEVRVRVTRSE